MQLLLLNINEETIQIKDCILINLYNWLKAEQVLYLEYAISQLEAIQVGNRNHRFLIVAHRHEPEALALLCRKVAHDLDAANCTEWAKQLPENLVIRVRGQIVDEQAPATSAVARRRQAIGQSTLARLQRRISATNTDHKPTTFYNLT